MERNGSGLRRAFIFRYTFWQRCEVEGARSEIAKREDERATSDVRATVPQYVRKTVTDSVPCQLRQHPRSIGKCVHRRRGCEEHRLELGVASASPSATLCFLPPLRQGHPDYTSAQEQPAATLQLSSALQLLHRRFARRIPLEKWPLARLRRPGSPSSPSWQY